ncbi:eukaryotic translation initiation factor 5B isoform X2 [Protopterus annectens]|uniref:eukaryotic translation initiation factor 5B isoform X2 n=1 Tax=Protopterus annectens TaxID=7888 RepID=UPI001CFA42C6|nr:eukaryotic translation initiation factor 5B isoform X2 [Protopterus annectens]
MGKKKNKTESSTKDDVDIDALTAEIEGAGSAKAQDASKPKSKKKRERKKDFSEDDILQEIEELSLENQAEKVDPFTAKQKTVNLEMEMDQSISKQVKGQKTPREAKKVFNEESGDEMENENAKLNKGQKFIFENFSSNDSDNSDVDGKGKNQKLLKNQSFLEYDKREFSKSKEDQTAVGESDEDSDNFLHSKKEVIRSHTAKLVHKAESDSESNDSSFKIKTAAQKKAEKKERERKKKEEERAKLKKQKEKEAFEVAKKVKIQEYPESEETVGPKQETKKVHGGTEVVLLATAEDKDELVAEDDDDDDDSKRKKEKKKKKGEKEEKKKGPGKAAVKAMQEALAKLKEEEERKKREEEEEQRRLEELEAKRLEQERLEQERKERKKQKEKEKKERLKKEGKLLTKAQKEARARAEATLKHLQAQGMEVPSKDSVPKKKPVYDNKKKKKVQQQLQSYQSENKKESVNIASATDNIKEQMFPEREESSSSPVLEREIKSEDLADDWEAMVSDEDKEKDLRTVHVEVEESNDEQEEGEEEDEEEDEESEDDGQSEESEQEKQVEHHVSARPTCEKQKRKESVSCSETESDSDDDRTKEERSYDKARRRIEKRRAENARNVNTEKLRAPVICVLGHVDTGKTKILDKLRHTHVQDGEAGGITQQIGATNVPLDAIHEQTKMVKNFEKDSIKIPGMLIIDTPGHESFSNLRNRGSSLCDIAILVVDIMHGLEPQTIESLNLLKAKKCPFIVALNKIDRLYDWKKSPDTDVVATLKKQKKNTRDEFEERAKAIIVEFAQQGLNAALFCDNKDPRTFVSLVPTSAHTGDGMGNLIGLLVELTQSLLAKRLAYCKELRAQVMEVKALPGMGTTIDVILINGVLKEGDTILVPGVEGPIVTQIRGLLLPPPMKELRVKNQYEKHKEVWAAQGVKILGKDLEKTLAGLPLLVAYKDDEIPVLRDELEQELKHTLSSIKVEDKGVYVQASTLGSLEALLEFLRTSEVPYSGINIGPVHKKDVMKASAMLEHDPQYSVILAFDVKIERDAQEMADSLGVRIFSAEIIYHLFDAFTKYRQDYKKQKQEEFKHIAVFPCKLRILPQFIFNSRDPIVMGVSVEAGLVKQGTPLCVPSKNFVDIGIITSIEMNHKPVDSARKGQEVCIKIDPIPGESPKMYGRHFEATDFLVSKINRQSIDALKNWFREEMQKSDWQLIVELKKVFEIL